MPNLPPEMLTEAQRGNVWMKVQLSIGKVVYVGFSDDAMVALRQRCSQWGVAVLSWDQFYAVAQGLAEVDGEERHARLREALDYFQV